MVEVYFCYVPTNGTRSLMMQLCQENWRLRSGFEIKLLFPENAKVVDFQLERRKIADSDAKGSIYVVADDDCLPQAQPFVAEAIEIMERHPNFGMLSLWPDNEKINRWTPEDYAPYEDEDIMEHVSVGGIRFCRKGIIKQWPSQSQNGYDGQHGEAMRLAGYRVGYLKHLTMTHLGKGRSTVWI